MDKLVLPPIDALQQRIIRMFTDVGVNNQGKFPYQKLKLKSVFKNGQETRVLYFANKTDCIELVPTPDGYYIYYLKRDQKKDTWKAVVGYTTDVQEKEMTVTNVVGKSVKIIEHIYKRYWR